MGEVRSLHLGLLCRVAVRSISNDHPAVAKFEFHSCLELCSGLFFAVAIFVPEVGKNVWIVNINAENRK